MSPTPNAPLNIMAFIWSSCLYITNVYIEYCLITYSIIYTYPLHNVYIRGLSVSYMVVPESRDTMAALGNTGLIHVGRHEVARWRRTPNLRP